VPAWADPQGGFRGVPVNQDPVAAYPAGSVAGGYGMIYDTRDVRVIHESPQPVLQRNRRSIRLQEYDYSQAGTCFVTICTRNRQCLFGEIVDGKARMNDAGRIVAEEWLKTVKIRNEIELDEWVVMPNHFHGILVLTVPIGAIYESPLQMTVSQRRNMAVPKIIGRFKMLSSKRINEFHQTPGTKLWQRKYWEHIVRSEPDLMRLREYIQNNPLRWHLDSLNPLVMENAFPLTRPKAK
jgi:REP element-mobilizing transposase RayT